MIISDNHNLPTLLRTNDKTEYYPCESVYAIGEIKSTYKNSEKPIQKFCNTIKIIKDDMNRKSIVNTNYSYRKTGSIPKSATIQDIYINSPNKILNPLFNFIIFVDSGDMNITSLKNIYGQFSNNYLPNLIKF